MQLNLGYLKFNNAKSLLIRNIFLLPEYSMDVLNPCLPEGMKIDLILSLPLEKPSKTQTISHKNT